MRVIANLLILLALSTKLYGAELKPTDFDIRSEVFNFDEIHSILAAAKAGQFDKLVMLLKNKKNNCFKIDHERNNVLHFIASNINLWDTSLLNILGLKVRYLASLLNMHGETPLDIARRLQWIGLSEYIAKLPTDKVTCSFSDKGNVPVRATQPSAKPIWWGGHCNAVEEPRWHDLSVLPSKIDGIEFSHDYVSRLLNIVNGNRADCFHELCKVNHLQNSFIIDQPLPVWNYPYDRLMIAKTDVPPLGFDIDLLQEHTVKFYRTELGGAFFDKGREYFYWIQKDSARKVTKSGWHNDSQCENMRDFMWRPAKKSQ